MDTLSLGQNAKAHIGVCHIYDLIFCLFIVRVKHGGDAGAGVNGVRFCAHLL